jgi:hypothetical protein
MAHAAGWLSQMRKRSDGCPVKLRLGAETRGFNLPSEFCGSLSDGTKPLFYQHMRVLSTVL